MATKKATAPVPVDSNSQTIVWYDLDTLVLWSDNYNIGDIGTISTSIRRFGFNNAPRVWRGLNVRGGNHTVLALRQIQLEGAIPDLDRQWPPNNVRVEGGHWLIPCIDIGDLTETEAIAFAITDNRAAALASQDETLLLKHLLTVYDDDAAMLPATGYDEEDLEDLRRALNVPVTMDNFEKSPREALDVYLNGSIKQIVLYFNAEDYLSAVERLTRVLMDNDLPSNTDTVLHLLDFYEQHHPEGDHADVTF